MARNSLKYELNKATLEGAELSDQTKQNYKQYNAHFRDYCIEHGFNTMSKVRDGGVGLLNDYALHLQKQGKSASTIHSYLSAPCRALDVNMKNVNKPRRTVAEGTKATGHNSDRSERESRLERYSGAYNFIRATGIREHEAKRLTGSCLCHDEAGNLCVSVISGKGGKDQMQVVLPKYEVLVRSAFRFVDADEKVFKASRFSKNINYHGARAQLAQEAYEYYKGILISPEARRNMSYQLYDRYSDSCNRLYEAGKINENQFSYKINKFARVLKDDSVYKLRGANLKSAIEHNKPVEYDRLCLMAVSVLHLSHWRLDVTVSNYMLK